MKKFPLPISRLLLLFTATMFSFLASAQTTNIWTGASGVDLNWSTTNNWDTSNAPGTLDSAWFVDTGATNDIGLPDNIVDTDTTINNLWFVQTNGVHNMLIAPGATLNVVSTNAGNATTATAGTVFLAGTIGASPSATQRETNTISGEGTLALNNPNGIFLVVQTTSGGNSSPLHSIVDMSSLNTFSASVARFLVGTEGPAPRSSGDLYLAKTNTITTSVNDINNPSLALGGAGGPSSHNSGRASILWLGQTNAILVDQIAVGRGKQGDADGRRNSIVFNPIFTNNNPVAYFRGSDGVSRIDNWFIADANGRSSGGTGGSGDTRGACDFTGGTVDALVNTMTLGNQGGGHNPLGTLTFENGTVNVNTLLLGVQTTSGNFGSGIVTVNGTGKLVANLNLALTQTIGGTGAERSVAALNINGGTVWAKQISVSAETTNATITVNNGTLIASNGIASTLGNVTRMALTNASLTLPAKSIAATANVNDLEVGSATLNIRSISSLAAYPAALPVIHYTTQNGAANITLGSLPVATPAYVGTLSNDTTTGNIYLVLTAGPISRGLAWDGTASGDWDVLTSANWLTNSGDPATVFNNGDLVQFDDSAAGTTDINIATTVAPGSLTVSNETRDYTFAGPGDITGDIPLLKQGAATLTISGSGNHDFSGGVVIQAGTVQLGNGADSGNLPSGGTIQNEGTLVINHTNQITIDSAISGGGSVINTNSGILTLSGNNSFTGAVQVLAGTLQTASGSALGTTNSATTISDGATLDVDGQSLGSEPIIVTGAGINGDGAIVNSGSDITTALRDVTLTGNTTFGGSGRWDIRLNGGIGQLVTGGNAYNITKTGSNQVSLVGITVDSAIFDIVVKQGELSFETTSTSLGDSSGTLTVSNGATMQFFSTTQPISKNLDLHGDGIATTLNFGGTGASGGINGAITVSGDVIIGNNTGANSTINSPVSGTANLMLLGSGTDVFQSSVSYVGSTVVSNTTVQFNGSKSGGTGMSIYGGTLGGSSSVTEDVTVDGGKVIPGSAFSPISSLSINGNLTLNNSTNVFTLQPNGVGSQVNGINTLTINGTCYITNAINKSNPVNKDDEFTLFSFNSSNADTNNLVVLPVVGSDGLTNFTFHLIINPNSVVLHVDTAIGNLRWDGTASVNQWNQTTVDWVKILDSTSTFFTDGDTVNFDGNAANPVVNLTTTVSPGAINVNDSGGRNYEFTGSGRITGNGGLIVDIFNIGVVTFDNSGDNDFTGDIVLNNGSLQLNNGANLLLGTGTIIATNGNVFGIRPLILNRTDSGLVVSNSIGRDIAVTNIGTGTVTLAGANTLTGGVYVASGTIKTANGSALGSGSGTVVTNFGLGLELFAPSGMTYVSNNASLDVNGQNLGAAPVTVIGSGVGGNGAIVNNGTSGANNAFRYVVLAGDTTFGGASRWDIRGTSALLTSPPNSPYNITKISTNQISLSGVGTIDPAISNIDIQGGIFSIETTTTNLGDPLGTLTVRTNATLQMYNLGIPLDKIVSVEDGGAIINANSISAIAGPVTLNGLVTLGSSGGTTPTLAFSNSVSGSPTGIIKTGTGTVLFGGTAVMPTPSALLDLAAGTLDLSSSASSTVTLASGQTMRGNGTLNGTLVMDGSTTLAPGEPAGDAIGTVTVSGTATIGGAVNLELNRDHSGTKNDAITATSIDLTGATVTVSNVGSDLIAGDTFKLFSVVPSGAYTLNPLPTLTAGLDWTNNLAVDGTISVISTFVPPPPQPTLSQISIVGGSVVLTGTNNNGTTPGTYRVLSSTNISLPLSNWTVLSTNDFDANGNANYTNGAPTEQQQFYILQVP